MDSEKLRFVQTLGDRWNFEFESSMPRVADRGSPTPPMPRRLTQLGINANTSSFIEAMRTQAQAAKGALATTNGDLTSAISGLDAALKRTAHDTADQQQVAKSMACDALTEATNAMDTVDASLANMMAHLAKARRTVEDPASRGKARETVAKKVFRKLQADVANVQQHIKQDKEELAKRLSSMQSLVSQISDSSLTSTRSSLMSAQGEIQQLQAELIVALKDFGALYRVVKGTGKLSDTVKLYASSVFYQLQEAFHVPMPAANNASVVLQECLEDPEGMITELECRLAYAQMVLEMFLGMEVDIRVDMSTSSTLPPIPMLPAAMAATTAAPTLAMQPVERSAAAGEAASTTTSMQSTS
uniref:Uncharacterized protein n=1 Tax=Alexandrium catenella TaxID=2925 RepID=A0A7S1W684_ALECA